MCNPSSLEISSFEKVSPGIKPLFFSQNIEQKLPEKKIPSTTANATTLLANDEFSNSKPHPEPYLIGLNKSGFIGYSWTYFFFGFFVPIFRGEIGIGLMHPIFSIITFGLFHLIMPFLYNRQYTTRLLTSGWKLNDTDDRNTLARLKIGISE